MKKIDSASEHLNFFLTYNHQSYHPLPMVVSDQSSYNHMISL